MSDRSRTLPNGTGILIGAVVGPLMWVVLILLVYLMWRVIA